MIKIAIFSRKEICVTVSATCDVYKWYERNASMQLVNYGPFHLYVLC